MKKIYLISFVFLALLSSVLQASPDSKLVGLWENASVSLYLKSDGLYNYKLNNLVKFSGEWNSDRKTITLNYKIAGIKKSKLVNYELSGKTLTIKKADRPDVKLTKSN
jgi:hypothetical protein